MVARDEGRQVRGGHPVQPADGAVGPGGGSRRWGVLAVTDHGDLDGFPGEQAQRGADDRGPLQRGVEAVEHHAQRAGIGPARHIPRTRRARNRRARNRRARGEPGRRGPHRDHHGPPPVPPGQRGPVLLGVHQHGIGGPQCRGVDQPEQRLARAAVQPPVPARVAGAGQVIEDDGHSAEQQPRQMHVEVTEVAHQHRVRYGHAASRPGQRGPPPGHPHQQGRRAPRVGQHRHPACGVQAQRRVAFCHLDPAVPQARAERGNSWVQGGVISAEKNHAHGFGTLAPSGANWTRLCTSGRNSVYAPAYVRPSGRSAGRAAQ